jgi:TonB family protein
MRHPRAGGVLVAWCLVAAWTPAPQGAETSACAKYAVRGIAPGMRAADVRARLGPGSAVGTVRGAAGPQTSVTYGGAKNLVVDVVYDRDIAQDPDGRVVLVRARGPAKIADPLAFVHSVVPGLGVPARGGEYLQDGFLSGSTVWTDDACQVEVTAYRENAEWWSPGERDVSVRITSTAASRPESTDEPKVPVPETAPVAVASEPAPLEPHREPEAAPVTEPAPRSDDATEPRVVPASQVEPKYPLRAMVLRITASVTLRVQVKRDGRVGDVEVVDTTRKGMGFEQAAIEAVKKWLYTPATRNGTAEDAAVTVRVSFD